MKLKRLPEDFQVEELSDRQPGDSGDFAFYRLSKRGLGTPEAIDAVLRRWRLTRQQVAFGGLKDRHAVTRQFLSIFRGPRRNLHQTNLELEYLGQVDRVFASSDISANRFAITVRDLTEAELSVARRSLIELGRDGLANYFDDQRFGSLGESGEFVAQAWIRGDYERALWLALADANPLDRPNDRSHKQRLRDLWGNWPAARNSLPPSPRHAAVEHLCHRPDDFRGALARLRPDIRNLYIAAFQSSLWNRLLSDFLKQACLDEQLFPVELKAGKVWFFRHLDEARRALIGDASLPLPSSRVKLEPGPIKDLVERSLSELGLAMREIRVKYPRDSFFSKGWRSATFRVERLEYETSDDELYRKRGKIVMRFELPRGSYATVLVKRVFAGAGPNDSDDLGQHAHEETEALS